MVENTEKFGAELKRLGFREAEILQSGKIPLLVAGALHDVSAGVSELSNLSSGIELLKSGWVVPTIRSAGVRAIGASALRRIADEVGAIAGEAGNFRRAALCGHARGVVHGERGAGHEGSNPIDLPAAENFALTSPGTW